MKTTRNKVARLLPLLVLLALAPMACTDAGDEPGGPTGAVSEYNPDADYADATITASASPSSAQPGEDVTVVATFRDGDGAAVSGMHLVITSDAGQYMTTPANPSVTDENGRASFVVSIDDDCPSGTYTFEVYTSPAQPINGPSAVGQCDIRVGGGGVTSVTLSATATTVEQGVPAPFVATAVVSDDCDPVFYYQASGAGTNTTGWTQTNGTENPNFFTVPTDGTTVGSMAVVVRVYCSGNDSAYAQSSSVSVTISAP